MKKLSALTTSLCAAVIAAAGLGGAAAHADAPESGIDYYPQSFSSEAAFENLEDYAVGENKYAFLEKNTVFEYDGENFYGYEDGAVTITAVYYKDGKVLCYGDGNGIYEYDSKEKTDLEADDKPVIAKGYVYSAITDGVEVYKAGGGSEAVLTLVGFSNPKAYGDTAYAVKDNALYRLNGAEYEKVPLPYLDFSPTETVRADGAAEKLKEPNPAPVFVTLKSGAYMTEIDVDRLDGDYFAAGKTVKVGAEITSGTALLLATVGAEGKISVVMVCGNNGTGKCYIMSSENAAAEPRESITAKELGATVTVDGAFIYSAPYVCKSTQLKDINSGDPLKVVGEIKRADNPELAGDFYKVEFSTEEGAQTGYVPFGYVSPFTYTENDPSSDPDPDYTEDNLIKEVTLIIIVIVLVLTAVGYIAYVLTSDKTKKQNGKKN